MWVYDEYFKTWHIDYSDDSDIERERSCDGCESRKQIGIDACCGCAG